MYSARPRAPDPQSREEWCRQHRTGHLSSVFAPLERLRCPHTRKLANGRQVTCGGHLGTSPHWCRETVVRALLGRPPIPNSDLRQQTCGSCRKMVDLFHVKHQDMKAAG